MPAKKTVQQALSGISNVQFWNEARKNSPKFESYTAAGTKETFTEKGFEALKNSDLNILNTFFELSLRVAFQKLDIARAKNGFEDSGLLEVYGTPNGGFVQRIAVESIRPITPQYSNLEDGSSVDPFRVRKPKTHERFFGQNYDYQNLITIQEYQAKQIFLDEYGMGQYIAGILAGLDSGRIGQETLNIKEVLNAGINSTVYPLKDSQKVSISWNSDLNALTEEQLKGLVQSTMDIMSAMTAADVPFTGMYNAAGFETHVDVDQYVMLLRSGIKNRLKTMLRVGAYNPEDIAIPVDRIVEVNDFGGLYPYKETAMTTRVFPIYRPLGDESGYFITKTDATSAGAALRELKDGSNNTLGYIVTAAGTDISAISNVIAANNVFWKDENAEVIGMIAQKGLIFENRQNPYSVQPIYNPAGIYTNYWANSPANGINYDYYYNVILLISQS